jgi:hypothetical protein
MFSIVHALIPAELDFGALTQSTHGITVRWPGQAEITQISTKITPRHTQNENTLILNQRSVTLYIDRVVVNNLQEMM